MFALPARSELYSGSSSGLGASGKLRRDLEEVPQNLGCELQCPPRRLLIDVGCVRSYGLKDAGRVLVVLA